MHLSDGQKERSKRALNRDCSDNEYTPLLQLPPCSHNGVLSGAVVRKDLNHLSVWQNLFNPLF